MAESTSPTVEADVPKVVGPTIPRWQLGEELTRLRRAANLTEADVADKLGCSESKIKKVEAGYVGTNRAELLVMLDMYGVTDEAARNDMIELQKRGKERGWWSKFGMVPQQFATFLSLESSATSIRVFEPLMVHGLLQTEDYTRAIVSTHTPGLTPDEIERQVQIRRARQERIFADPPQTWIILDEAVLHRRVGGTDAMRAQLTHILDTVKANRWLTLQVVPYSHGSYPGELGAFTIFDFEEDIHSPVVYVEGQAGGLYLERDADLRRCNLAYNHITAAALSPPESAKLITALTRATG
ncbi:helix-turn-helix transcriptional regulator [Solwaraspora sp. WMMD791]|uniref:helix-turn-helix domain-containing protein n=1 Tax=Solwaraspora sp. WMMD791 TaxID=3016086 RepID=UPI002499FF10|nr:helix-turn-helix transcriptional regulator [Solwaraspora sp. WMMD791]WFE29441.1 helix-turn-helix transcriptional regulator [Solwaraspora sp. WMMD791]